MNSRERLSKSDQKLIRSLNETFKPPVSVYYGFDESVRVPTHNETRQNLGSVQFNPAVPSKSLK